jgi:23S rRNA pseudouridine2605 synthase
LQIHADYGGRVVRLAKYLASAGVASRRAAEQIVRSGRVSIAGVIVVDPARDVTGDEPIALDGVPVPPRRHRSVYALNKPAGVVSTARDPQGRPTVVSLVSAEGRLYPVGRLDIDTVGLILLTDDGDLAYRLTHPSFEVDKTYRAVVKPAPIRAAALGRLRAGVELEDGPTAPARVRRLAADTLEITIHEGRKRQIRRMCEAVGYRVRSLQRVRFGPLELGDLAQGQYRRLDAEEVRRLQEAGGRSPGPTVHPAGAAAPTGEP